MTNKPMIRAPFGDFQTKVAIKAHIQTWLWSYEPGDKITDPDIVEGLDFLIRHRKSKMMEIGNRKIVGWTIETNNSGTRCFAAVLDDGCQIHFSFYKAVDRLYQAACENA